ncbi:O-acetylhomoserine aminocarboxypropyltransferase/cysteine synthase family protein [Microbacterium sp. SORGH_AS_0888]|uniref:O-acetylhomoserine aminocarboxypropyltransferase/cysteine synthase family protein n=1 Tax=Microbacterium sp. SORGH_AS_0888 TaxID=3041791 RepID=UPI002788ECD0|nr:aminotransferase class I/II-fold pyridoxal phosphate-dependent enzyme [Microbacterium sp. SORGH_AS_0888]MDQ1130551.1 O-acetylhomoserine (thiol)-lyase [Microbacterium sp. SORGH_AS_0888]
MSGDAAEPEYDWSGYGFDTRQVHAGEEPNGHDARITPVYLGNGFRFGSLEEGRARFAHDADGLVYSRSLNPTGAVAERRIASLEGGTGAVVVGSGAAAITSALQTVLEAGDHFLSTASIYSGTRILFDGVLARSGIEVGYVWDWRDASEWRRLIRPETKAIFTETIPNPRNDVVDIAAVAEIAREAGVPVIVDNTVATPYLSRPIEQGAHVVVHSATKFLAGHGAVIAGAIVDGGTFDWAGSPHRYGLIAGRPASGEPSFVEQYGNERAFEQAARLAVVNNTGPALSPLNSFLLQQGIETLSLRMERHLDSARTIAEWLAAQPEVESVDYSGLPGHPDHDLATRLYGGRPGSVFAVTIRGGVEGARAVHDGLRVFSRMTNIGDVRSMVLHAATTTHLHFTPALRERLGIHPGLLRLSIGLETVDDLIADLRQALDRVPTDSA